MKNIAFIVLFLLIAKSTFSQTNLDKLMLEKAPNCEDIAFNSSQLIEKYYNNEKFDSVKMILDYWESKCGLCEPILRIKILIAIKNKEFNESIYDSTIIDYIQNFKNRIETRQPTETYNYYKVYYSFVQINGSFDKFTKMLAIKLLIEQKENSLEFLFCKLYSGESTIIYTEIQKKDVLNNSKLKEYYFHLINKCINLPEFHWSLYSGIWIPLDKAKILGNHPFMGFEMGSKYHKINYNISMYFKFSQSANEYTFMLDDSLWSSKYFFGGYIGFDVERELIKIKSNELDIIGGIAYDGFDALQTNTSDKNTENDQSKSFNSLNLNIGIGYKFILKNNTYIGLRTKYNFIHYKNEGGTNLTGNTITLALVVGGFSNYQKNNTYKSLNYKK